MLLLLTCLASGCTFVDEPVVEGDEPVQPETCGASSSGGDGDCDPYDQVHFIGTHATALCSFLFDCCSGVERNDVVPLLLGGDDALDQLLVVEPELLVEELACVRAFGLALAVANRDNAVALLDEAGARRAFDRDAAEVCIGQAEEAAELCAPPLLLLAQPEECGRIFAPAVAEGGRCTSDADCLDIDGADALCFANDGVDGAGGLDVSLTGQCQAPGAAGDACPFEVLGAVPVCAAGLFCSDALVCLPLGNEGEPCGGRPCAAGLQCVPIPPDPNAPGVTGVCLPPPAPPPLLPEGTPGCLADSDCETGFCATVDVGGGVVLDVCVAAPVIDPEQIRFDFCLDERGNASLADVIPADEPDEE